MLYLKFVYKPCDSLLDDEPPGRDIAPFKLELGLAADLPFGNLLL